MRKGFCWEKESLQRRPCKFYPIVRAGSNLQSACQLTVSKISNIRIFPETKLRGLVLNFYIHVSGSNLYISMISLIWNLYFPVWRERTLGSTAGAEGRERNCRQPLLGGSSLPFSPLLRVHINDQHTNFPVWKITDYKQKNQSLQSISYLVLQKRQLGFSLVLHLQCSTCHMERRKLREKEGRLSMSSSKLLGGEGVFSNNSIKNSLALLPRSKECPMYRQITIDP